MQEGKKITKKHDFVEIEFTGKTEEGIFDTNISSEAKKLNPNADPKPLRICIGEQMIVKGFDKALEDKEIGKEYVIKLSPEEAYGRRNPKLIKLIPKKLFLEHKINPIAGMTVALDNALVKIIASSGGRVLVDFNNPLAGKELEFKFKIIKRLDNQKDKINALQNFFFRQEFDFDLDEQNKKIIFEDTNLTQILNLFKDKFKELIGYDVEILAKPQKNEKPEKPEKKEEKSGKTQEEKKEKTEEEKEQDKSQSQKNLKKE